MDQYAQRVHEGVCPWRYADRRVDVETGFIAFGLRYYNSNTGTWITKDPSGYDDGPNLYAYVHGNPLIYADCLGLNSEFLNGFYSTLNNVAPYAITAFGPAITMFSYRRAIQENNYDHLTQPATSYDLNTNYTEFGFDNPPNFTEHKNCMICFMPGIDNTKSDLVKTMRHINNMAAGYNIHTTFCPTLDTVNDVLRYFVTLGGYKHLDGIKLLHQQWDKFIARADAHAILLQLCHSWGVVLVRNALETYPEEKRKRIDVVALCPGGYIDKKLCNNVWHYVCPRDPITYIDQKGKQMAGKQESIHYVKQTNSSIFKIGPHSICDEIFQQPIAERIYAHKRKYLP